MNRLYTLIPLHAISAIPGRDLCKPLLATPTLKYLPSVQLYDSDCSTFQAPRIKAQPGQKINFTLISLSTDDVHKFGVIMDDQNQKQIDLSLRGGQKDRALGLSASHSVSVVLHDAYNKPSFIIGFHGE